TGTGTGTGTASDCPVGFCPRGATCSQLSGQWQCGCGTNGCVGVVVQAIGSVVENVVVLGTVVGSIVVVVLETEFDKIVVVVV
ncbi:unnamed protein product, partial [Rotaria sp. Silwood1]